MAGRIVMEGRTTDAPALAIGGKFGKFGPEEERSSSKAEVKESEAFRKIMAIWKSDHGFDFMRYKSYYQRIREAIANVRYAAEDVEGFSLALGERQHEADFMMRAGLFLSALINTGSDREFRIHVNYENIAYLGYNNKKIIHVKGYAGLRLGYGMKSGSITVNGDCGDCLGMNMEGGTITVKGNADTRVAELILGGTLHIHGSCQSLGYAIKNYRYGGDIGSPGMTIIAEPDGTTIFCKPSRP
jgi:hypothetical protein